MPSILNPHLIEVQNVSLDNQQKLHFLHAIKYKLYDIPLTDIHVPTYVQAMEDLEFQAQQAWGFPQDSAHHNWWFNDPKCSCPPLDNKDRIPYGRIYSGDCPLHGHHD